MRDRINIDKALMPYNFDIVLAGDEFNMEWLYNKRADLFTCTLSKDGETIVYDEPVIYGHEMFSDLYVSGKYPKLAIVPLDEAGIEDTVTYDNFNKTVFLTIDNG